MPQSRTKGDDRDPDQSRRLYASISQFQRDRPWPDHALGPVADATLMPGALGGTSTQLPPEPYAYAPRVPAEQQMPIQAVVDRLAPLHPMLVDIQVRNKHGKLIQILRYPEFGTYGADPNDPGWFSETVNPRTVICAVLAPYAAARCLVGVGYW